MEDILSKIAIYAIPILLAITIHEAAHGYVARMFGDNTAYAAGRITLNPIAHIDPIGTILVPLLLLLFSSAIGHGIIFGWAKPVPVNFNNLRNPKRDMMWVAGAGPASNLFMAICWLLLAKLLLLILPESFDAGLRNMAEAGVVINILFFAFNLLPIPPLDGGRIAVSLLPHRAAWQLSRIEPFGLFVVLALVYSGLLGYFLSPFIYVANQVLSLFS